MTHLPVRSSTLATVGYDAATRALEIRFKPGKKDAALGKPGPLWSYADVPPEAHQALLAAESPGAYFAAEIKPTYTAIRVA